MRADSRVLVTRAEMQSYVDEQIRKRTAGLGMRVRAGTVVASPAEGDDTLSVVMDGSASAVQVKMLGALPVLRNDRVTLVKVGSDWTCAGPFTAGGGILLPQSFARKTSDGAQNNTATLIDDSELFVTFPTKGEYFVAGQVFFQTTATENFKYTFVTSDAVNDEFRWISSAGGATQQMFFDTQVQNVARTNSFQGFLVNGRYNNPVNAGKRLTLQWAQQTGGAGPTAVVRGSHLRWWRAG